MGERRHTNKERKIKVNKLTDKTNLAFLEMIKQFLKYDTSNYQSYPVRMRRRQHEIKNWIALISSYIIGEVI